MMPPLCVSVAEAAQMLAISPWMVRNLIARRLLPRVTLPSTSRKGEDNRRVLIAVVDLEKFVAQHRDKAQR